MFTPEFLNEERGEFLLVANHCLGSRESIQLSIAFNLARISYGLSHLRHTFEAVGLSMISGANQSLTRS